MSNAKRKARTKLDKQKTEITELNREIAELNSKRAGLRRDIELLAAKRESLAMSCDEISKKNYDLEIGIKERIGAIELMATKVQTQVREFSEFASYLKARAYGENGEVSLVSENATVYGGKE
jgi:chromosome segregation ATPase